MAVVKANAYGHGVGLVVRTLRQDVQMFGVANVDEAHDVRAEAPEIPVFILGPALPDERAEIVRHGYIPSISSPAEAKAYAQFASGRKVPVHIVLDTGMGRIGIWEAEVERAAREIAAIPELEIAGFASHLPVADEDEEFTVKQLARFHSLTASLRELGLRKPIVHVENSAGVIGFAAQAGDLVRTGLALYGSAPIPSFQGALRPVLTWKTQVTLVRDVGAGRGVSYGRTFITPRPMRVATLAVGYADGYQRHLSNQGAEVLIEGRRCPVLGRVTMDQIMVDVSGLHGVEPGTEAVLLGKQGGEEILAGEMARKAGTIPWEIFTGIGNRVIRVTRPA
jgi:alanine racemase